jgi:hypothetical protein
MISTQRQQAICRFDSRRTGHLLAAYSVETAGLHRSQHASSGAPSRLEPGPSGDPPTDITGEATLRKKRQRQEELWYGGELPTAPGHPFYKRLNEVLDNAGFDAFCETICARFYQALTTGARRFEGKFLAPHLAQTNPSLETFLKKTAYRGAPGPILGPFHPIFSGWCPKQDGENGPFLDFFGSYKKKENTTLDRPRAPVRHRRSL